MEPEGIGGTDSQKETRIDHYISIMCPHKFLDLPPSLEAVIHKNKPHFFFLNDTNTHLHMERILDRQGGAVGKPVGLPALQSLTDKYSFFYREICVQGPVGLLY